MNAKNITKKGPQKISAGLWEKPKKPIMKPFKHTLTMNNKKHEYIITPINKREVFFECVAAGISQRFLSADIPALLIDLPELIISEQKFQEKVQKQGEIIRFRISADDKKEIEKRAIKNGYSTISAFLRALALEA